jgi:hypothetical protein
MLHFTAAGAVAAPGVVQVRVTSSFPGRVAAGAPAPTRALADAEVEQNLRYFTLDRGTRRRACTSVVLSGADLPSRPGLAAVLVDARRWGIERVTLHLGEGAELQASSLCAEIDAVSIAVTTSSGVDDIVALRSIGGRHTPLFVTATVPLDAATRPHLAALAEGLARAGPDRVVFGWPFHRQGAPIHADALESALTGPFRSLDAAGVSCGVKGVPACRLGALSSRLWLTGNRWYVDADHQRDRALLFFPEVVRFARVDECRFCRAADRCDGAVEAWLAAGLTGKLRAIPA